MIALIALKIVVIIQLVILIILFIINLIISYFKSSDNAKQPDGDEAGAGGLEPHTHKRLLAVRVPLHHRTLEEPIGTNVKRPLPNKPVATVPAKNTR